MNDAFSLDASGPARALSVSELTRAIRGVLEEGFGEVWIEGEISNYRKQPSGHQYFTLKDDGAQLSCVWFFRGQWRKQAALQDGMQIRARGRLTVYEARGQYQLNVQSVEAAGEGLLQAKFEAIKRRLQAEGLFDQDRKRPLPSFPGTVALVTSAAGSVLRDMLNIFARRAPWVRLILSPVRVQGDGSAEEIAQAIAELNDYDINGLPKADVIIVARGGGSTEDLWEFNEEMVARAVAGSSIPVVSAVGHETDFTICDFAADLRAPTPSAAAEIVVPDATELSRRIAQLGTRMQREVRSWMDALAQRVDGLGEEAARAVKDRLANLKLWLAARAASVREHRPDHVIQLRRQDIARLQESLARRMAYRLEQERARLKRAADHLRLLSPDGTLQRGYSITTAADGRVVTEAGSLQKGDRIQTRLADGTVSSRID